LRSGANLPPHQLTRDAERITSRRRSFLRPFPRVSLPSAVNLGLAFAATRVATTRPQRDRFPSPLPPFRPKLSGSRSHDPEQELTPRAAIPCTALLSRRATGPAPENTCSTEHAGTPQVRRPGGHRTPSTTLYKPDAAPFRQRRNVRTVPGDDSPKCLPRARNLRLPGGSGTPREDRGAEQAGSLAMTRRPSCRRDNSRRFPTHVPLGGRKRSAALPWRGPNAFTD
jgi:hypothetical protein